jgi:hypothetical protein
VTCASTATCKLGCGVDGATAGTKCPDGRLVCGAC